MRKPRLDENGRKVLAELNRQMPSNDGWMPVASLMNAVDVWPIRPTLDGLKRRGLVEWRGSYSNLADRDWRLTDAGVEAAS